MLSQFEMHGRPAWLLAKEAFSFQQADSRWQVLNVNVTMSLTMGGAIVLGLDCGNE